MGPVHFLAGCHDTSWCSVVVFWIVVCDVMALLWHSCFFFIFFNTWVSRLWCTWVWCLFCTVYDRCDVVYFSFNFLLLFYLLLTRAFHWGVCWVQLGVRLSPDGYQKILPLCSLFIVITATTRLLTAGTSYSVIAADVMYRAINVYVVVAAAAAAAAVRVTME